MLTVPRMVLHIAISEETSGQQPAKVSVYFYSLSWRENKLTTKTLRGTNSYVDCCYSIQQQKPYTYGLIC